MAGARWHRLLPTHLLCVRVGAMDSAAQSKFESVSLNGGKFPSARIEKSNLSLVEQEQVCHVCRPIRGGGQRSELTTQRAGLEIRSWQVVTDRKGSEVSACPQISGSERYFVIFTANMRLGTS